MSFSAARMGHHYILIRYRESGIELDDPTLIFNPDCLCNNVVHIC